MTTAVEPPNVYKPLIIFNKKESLMSFEDVYNRYQGLLKKAICPWMPKYEYDELFQEATIGLWQAYQKYDASCGYAFSTCATTAINNHLLMYNRKNRPKFDLKTSKIKVLLSLNAPINDESDTELKDIISEAETFSQKIADDLFYVNLLKKLPKRNREYIRLFLNGHQQIEIAEMYQINSILLCKKMKAAFSKLKGLYLKEVAP